MYIYIFCNVCQLIPYSTFGGQIASLDEYYKHHIECSVCYRPNYIVH